MPRITYVASGGEELVVEAENGQSVMEAAVRNGVSGIEAECGGACSCATCHAYIDESWLSVVGKPDEMEEEMLEFAHEPAPNSRLTCQIEVTDELEGLRLRLPQEQG